MADEPTRRLRRPGDADDSGAGPADRSTPAGGAPVGSGGPGDRPTPAAAQGGAGPGDRPTPAAAQGVAGPGDRPTPAGGAPGLLDGLRLALTTLTVLPVRGPDALTRRTAGQAMALAPAVGALLALALVPVVVVAADAVTGPPLLAAALGVAGLALLTRGLHLDGLADLADGLGSHKDPAGARAVMKAPDVGALGLAAVVLVLLVQVTALSACLSAGVGGAALAIAVVTGRLAVTGACTRGVKAATPDGLGALVAGSVPGAVTAVVAVIVAVLASVALAVDGGEPALGPLAAALGLGAAALLLRHAVRRVGGVTGDVLGALVEVTTSVVLVVLALAA